MNNPHGVGVMWRAADGTTRRQRYFQRSEESYKLARSLSRQGLAYAVHYRFSTHGQTNLDNVHPFKCGSGAALMHNGCIGLYDKDKSDTALLADSLAAIGPFWFRNPHVWNLLELSVEGSRLVVCTPDGWTIVHETTGHWHEGRWYSARTRAAVVGYSEPSSWAGGNGATTPAPRPLQTIPAPKVLPSVAAVAAERRERGRIENLIPKGRTSSPLQTAWQEARQSGAKAFTNPDSGSRYEWDADAKSYYLISSPGAK